MTILAIDTSGSDQASIALEINNQSHQQLIAIDGSRHSKLLDYIKDLLTVHNQTIQSINKILFCHGPGSFTGTRIAATITQGISMVNNAAVCPVSSMDLIACKIIAENITEPSELSNLTQSSLNNNIINSKLEGYKSEDKDNNKNKKDTNNNNNKKEFILTGIDARMNQLYYAWFDNAGNKLTEDDLASPSHIQLPSELLNIHKTNNQDIPSSCLIKISGNIDMYLDEVKDTINNIIQLNKDSKDNVNIEYNYNECLPEAKYMFDLHNKNLLTDNLPGEAYPIYLRPGVILNS